MSYRLLLLVLLALTCPMLACSGLSSSDDFAPDEDTLLTNPDTTNPDDASDLQYCQEFCDIFSTCQGATLDATACLTHCTSTAQDPPILLTLCIIDLADLITGDDDDYADYAEEICALTALTDLTQCDLAYDTCEGHCTIFEVACDDLGLDPDACAPTCINAHLDDANADFRCNQDALASAQNNTAQKDTLCLTALNGCASSERCVSSTRPDNAVVYACASQCKPAEPRCEGGLICQDDADTTTPDYCVECFGPSCATPCNPSCSGLQSCVNGSCKTPCVSDTCASGSTCVNGYCEASSRDCNQANPCPDNQRCISGFCYDTPPCGAVVNCGPGETCNAESKCACGTTQGNLGSACNQTSEVCTSNGQCTPYSPVPCGDRPCQPGESCTANQCTCGTIPCAPGQYCAGGQCLN